MNHGDTPNWKSFSPARYNKSVKHAETEQFLADPIAFAQNIDRVVSVGCLQELLLRDVPLNVDDLRDEWEVLVGQAIERGDREIIQEVFMCYTEFLMYATQEARELGVAIGAVMEQFRTGLVAIVDQTNRGLSDIDIREKQSMQDLRRKYGFSLEVKRDPGEGQESSGLPLIGKAA